MATRAAPFPVPTVPVDIAVARHIIGAFLGRVETPTGAEDDTIADVGRRTIPDTVGYDVHGFPKAIEKTGVLWINIVSALVYDDRRLAADSVLLHPKIIVVRFADTADRKTNSAD